MGKITTLKNKGTDETLYPITVPSAIRDENGNRVVEQIQNNLNNHTHQYVSESGKSARLEENSSTNSSDPGGLTWFNTYPDAAQVGAFADINDIPTSAWWYINRNRHTNTSNDYYTDVAIPFNDKSIYYKIVRNGSVVDGRWIKVLDDSNYTNYAVTNNARYAHEVFGSKDFNTYITSGFYRIDTLSDYTNAPTSGLSWGQLIVSRNYDTIFQIYCGYAQKQIAYRCFNTSLGNTGWYYTARAPFIASATISTTWSGSGPYTQSVTVSGILSTDNPHIMPNYSTTNTTAILQKEAWGAVSKAVTANNTITFTCFEEKPTTAIPITIEVIR